MSLVELTDSVQEPAAQVCIPVNLSPIVPPSVTGSFTPDCILRCRLASAHWVKPVARIRQAVHQIAALCYPSPSRVWDRATEHQEKLSSFQHFCSL